MKFLLIAGALAAALSHAFAQDISHGGHGEATKAFEAANQGMMKGMAMPVTGDVDQDFTSMMIAYHGGFIDMAKVELQYGKDPKLRQLAQDIIAAQEKRLSE